MSDSLDKKATSRRRFAKLVAVAASALVAGAVVGCKKEEAKPAAGTSGTAAPAAKKSHECAGKNECRGQGGCGSSDQGCKGKNTCRGKGGCNSAH